MFSSTLGYSRFGGRWGMITSGIYYIPDVEAYYDVSAQQYIYFNNGSWVRIASVPFSNFDIYNTYKVVINDPTPWMNHSRYRDHYHHYRGRHNQPVIRDSRNQRYWANPGHPKHKHWRGHEKSRDWGGQRGNNKQPVQTNDTESNSSV